MRGELKIHLVFYLFHLLCPKRTIQQGIDASDLNKISLPDLQQENEEHLKHLETGITSIYGPPTAKQVDIGPDAIGVAVDYNVSNDDPNDTSMKDFKFYIKYPLKEPGYSFEKEHMKKLNLWPEAKVPYYIDTFSFDTGLREKIREFLSDASVLTGLHFTELSQVPDEKSKIRWVLFLNRRQILDCEDYTTYDFNQKNLQDVVLGYDCIDDRGKMAGLVLALASVPPMHNAPDRDKYIEVKTDEIINEHQKLFNKLNDNQWLFADLPYDFKSAGHFHTFKHSKNGKSTIEPKVYTDVDIGYAADFSPIDILKVRMMYNTIAKTPSINPNAEQCNKLFKIGEAEPHNPSFVKPVFANLMSRPLPQGFSA